MTEKTVYVKIEVGDGEGTVITYGGNMVAPASFDAADLVNEFRQWLLATLAKKRKL